jgi:transcriptional regulator with XRE-family HTH domain
LPVHRIVPGSVYTVRGCRTLCEKCHAGEHGKYHRGPKEDEAKWRKAVGERLKALREARLVPRCWVSFVAGVPEERLRDWEKGIREPVLSVAALVAAALRVSLDELAGQDGLSAEGRTTNEDPVQAAARVREVILATLERFQGDDSKTVETLVEWGYPREAVKGLARDFHRDPKSGDCQRIVDGVRDCQLLGTILRTFTGRGFRFGKVDAKAKAQVYRRAIRGALETPEKDKVTSAPSEGASPTADQGHKRKYNDAKARRVL